MENYQVLSLIGCIFGILITIALVLLGGFVISITDDLLNMNSTTEQERTSYQADKSTSSIYMAGAAIAFLLYVGMLVITFVVKTNIKFVGIMLLALGVIAMIITNFWGIIPFALLLPAGIVALRHKPQTVRPI